jgi:phage-related holin
MTQKLSPLIASIALVFMPIKATLITVMVLTVADLITGITASRKEGKKITSSGLKRTIIKTTVYELVVMLGFLTERYMIGDALPVVKILAGFIGLTELKSVLENIERISGMPIIKLLIERLNQTDKK